MINQEKFPSFSIEENAILNREKAEIDPRISIGIKVPILFWENAHNWGDFHFVICLRLALIKKGYDVLIILKNEPVPIHVGVLLVIRGLKCEYNKRQDQLQILWNISHPEEISKEEYNTFNYIFVASEYYATRLKKSLNIPVEVLLQCTDPDQFQPVITDFNHEVLFVGNSRGIYRPIVSAAIDAGVNLSVYGSNWEEIISNKYIKGEYVPNNVLQFLYCSAHILLNDHWDDMKRYGFISNRIFDALACNTQIISDSVIGLNELFPEVITYSDKTDFKRKIKSLLSKKDKPAHDFRKLILLKHTFDHRAEKIHNVIQKLI